MIDILIAVLSVCVITVSCSMICKTFDFQTPGIRFIVWLGSSSFIILFTVLFYLNIRG
nr:MAG TPA: hypothetical protein [Caudoviricetes sp.]